MITNKAVSMISLVLTIVIIIVLAAITAPLLSSVLNDTTRLDTKEEFANVYLVVQNAKREILAEQYVPNQEYVIDGEELVSKFGKLLTNEELEKINSDNIDSTVKAPFKYYLLNQERFDKEFGSNVNVKRIRSDREYLVNFMDEVVIANYDGQKMIEGSIMPISQAVRGDVNIIFSPNGNSEWKSQQSASVTLSYNKNSTPTESIVANYVWSESASHPSDTEFAGGGTLLTSGVPDSNGDVIVRTTGVDSPPNLTGNGWYLWVRIEFKDDTQTKVKYEKSGSFFLDNTAPTFELEVS